MDIDNDILAAIFGFVGAIFGAGVTNLVTAYIAIGDRQETKRKEQRERLLALLEKLVDERTNYETLIKGDFFNASEHNRIIAYTKSLLLSLDDGRLTEIAHHELRDYDDSWKKEATISPPAQANIRLLSEALRRVGSMITDLSQTKRFTDRKSKKQSTQL